MPTPFARRIRKARERKGLTQQQVGTTLGVTGKTVGNWERGETVPRNRLAALGDLLGIELDEFADASDDLPVSPTEEAALLNLPPSALEGLSEAERAEVVAGAQQRALEIARAIRKDLDVGGVGEGRALRPVDNGS